MVVVVAAVVLFVIYRFVRFRYRYMVDVGLGTVEKGGKEISIKSRSGAQLSSHDVSIFYYIDIFNIDKESTSMHSIADIVSWA